MRVCAQGSVGILTAHMLRPATRERRIATTPPAAFTSSGSLGGCLRKSGILVATSVAVHPRALLTLFPSVQISFWLRLCRAAVFCVNFPFLDARL